MMRRSVDAVAALHPLLLGLAASGPLMARYGCALGMTVLARSDNITEQPSPAAGAVLATKDELFDRSDVAVASDFRIVTRLSERHQRRH
jgi:hypothetical protein